MRQGFGKQLKKWLGKIPRIIIKMQTAIHGCHSGSSGEARNEDVLEVIVSISN